MEGIIKGTAGIVLRVLGLQKISDMWPTHPWLAIVTGLCIGLTLVWMFRFKEGKTAAMLGKFPGSIAAAFIYIQAGIGIAVAIIQMVAHYFLDGLSAWVCKWLGWFPLFGHFVCNVTTGIVETLSNAAITLGMLIFGLMSLVRIIGMVWNAFTGAAQKWEDPKAPHGVKLWYQIAGSIVIAVIICNPAVGFTVGSVPIPLLGLLSASFGVYTLLTTEMGRRVAKRAGAKLLGGPINEKGDWDCPNPASAENVKPLLDEKLQPIRKENGKVKGTTEGVCGWRNLKKARHCRSPICGPHPNPYWQVCTECGFAGPDGQGYRRAKPDLPDICPECGNIHPALPKWTKFHLPGKPAPEPKPVSKPAKAAKPKPSKPAVPIKIELDDSHYTRACPACGESFDSRKGYRNCPFCRHSLEGQTSRTRSDRPAPKSPEHRGLKSKWRRTF